MISFARTFNIGTKTVGEHQKVFIIAEAGVAHFGSLKKALLLVDMAVEAGADAVKFQIFQTDELISAASKEWQDRLRSKELSYDNFKVIKQYCLEKEILFFATAHDESSLEYLDELDVPMYKIGSGEIENWSFFRRIAQKHKPIIFSTGMYTEEQIEKALSVISETGNNEVAVLHCVTSYPTNPSDVNLQTIKSIRRRFKVITGYSDHTEGIHFPLASVALGAKVVEKHISLDFNVPNAQDWKVSCDQQSLVELVRQIRDIEVGLGEGRKRLIDSEQQSLAWARKSIVAGRNIEVGEVVNQGMLKAKRPGTGISPAESDKVIGKQANSFIKKDTLVTWEHLK